MTAATAALSELSVSEFLTLGRLGFFPKGVAIGASFFDAGWVVQGGSFTTRELTPLADAMREARRRAVLRLRGQASRLGAEGVVDVRVEVEHHRWRGGHMVARFVAYGTAIAFDPSRAAPELAQAPSLKVKGHPFTSDLKASEFVTLLRAGYRPVSIAMGNSVMQLSAWNTTFGNQEITGYTQAFMNARELAMLRLEEDLFQEYPRGQPDAPTGVVGMKVTANGHGDQKVIEFTAVGTAIAAMDPNDPRRAEKLPAPQVVVPLDR